MCRSKIGLLFAGLLAGLLAAPAAAAPLENAPPPPGAAQADAPRRVALLVGVDAYADPELGSLRYAAKDADDLADVLADPAVGNFDRVDVLRGEVSQDAFWDALDDATARLRRGDTFLLFVAGHGTLALDEGTRLYILPSDGELERPAETGIALAELQQVLSLVPSRRRALILDTCHSGTGRSVISQTSREKIAQFRGPIPAPAASAVSQSEVRLYSTHFNQPALEDSKLENGVYTHFLIQALTGNGDSDGDGLIEAAEAHAWARDQTLLHTGGLQVPWMETQLVGRESVYLTGDPDARREAERAILVGLAALPASARLSIDGQLQRGAGVPPGWRRVEVAIGGETLVDQPVRLQPGEELDLAALVTAREARWWIEAGGQATLPNEWTATAGPQGGVAWLPADAGGGRPLVGLQATMGITDIPSGQVMARGGWVWGQQLVAGPTLDAGLFWRLRGGQRQGAPIFAPGVAGSYAMGPIQLTAHASALSFVGYEDGAQQPREWLPRAGLAVGWAP